MRNLENIKIKKSKPTAQKKVKTNMVSDFFISIIFLYILIFLPASYFIEANLISEVEQRKLTQLPIPSLHAFVNNSFQQQLNVALTDQFPGREKLLVFRSMIFRNINRIAYAPLPDRAIPISDNSNILIWHSKQGVSLIDAPEIYQDEVLAIIDQRVEEYNMIAELLPDVNFYVFDIERPMISIHHPATRQYYGNIVGSAYRDYFLSHVCGIHYGELPIRHEDDIINHFYRTDHHWNIYGAWKCYEILYAMLKLNYPEISSIKNVQFEKVFGIDSFRGSYARLAAYLTVSDDFYVIKMEHTEPHITVVNGISTARGLREINSDRQNVPNSPFTN